MIASNKKIKILAIDDTPSNLIALESVFHGTDYVIIEAHSGKEALWLLTQHDDIAVVLLDVQMPTMDGFETAMRIKQIPECKELPIIFITAVYNEDPFIRRGYESGAIDYFSKPFDPAILRMKVDMYSSFRQKSFLLKERELRIQQTEELLTVGRSLTGVFETLAVGILIADKDGKIFQSNEAITRIFKSTVATDHNDYGKSLGWWDEGGTALKDEKSVLWQALQKGQTTHNEVITIKCLDDSEKRLLSSASPLIGLDKKIVGAVVILQDVTESRKIEEAFEEKLAKLISLTAEVEHIAQA